MENNHTKHKDKIQNILEKIEKNELTSRSKTYFRLRLAALIVIALAAFIISTFLFSFIFFSLRAVSEPSLIGFGPSGFTLFLMLFPWNLLALDIVLIVFLGWLLRTFRFGYKSPVLYLLLGVFAVLIVSGFIVDRTSLHEGLLDQADRNALPGPFIKLYEGARRPPPVGHGVYRGTITAVNDDIITVELDNPLGEGTTTPIKVFLPSAGMSDFLEVGNKIFIGGEIVDGEIHTFRIKGANRLPPSSRTLPQ